MAELTDEQQATLDEKRLGTGKRPKIHDALSGLEEEIGEDYEGFAILIDPELREDTIDRLQQANEGNDDRDTLYQEALDGEKADALVMLEDFDNSLSGFMDFREAVFDTPFGDSPELGPMMLDMQRLEDEAFEGREREFHRQQASLVLTQLIERADGTEDEKQQRDSWEPALSEYRE